MKISNHVYNEVSELWKQERPQNQPTVKLFAKALKMIKLQKVSSQEHNI